MKKEVNNLKLIKRLRISRSIMKATLSLSVPLLLVTAGNYVAFAEQVATTILLDVNPSIEITINKIDEVIEVNALNKDAETVIEDMDLEGVDVDVAMHVIVGSMVRKGYIDEAKNAVLVTVENEDKSKQQELERVVTSEINDRLVVAGIAPIIFTQEAAVKKADNTSVKACAKEHDISLNKAAFIQKILKENKTLSVDKLVAMNVEALSDIIRSKNINLHDSVGYSEKAMSKADEKAAEKQAVAAARVKEAKSKDTEKQPEAKPQSIENPAETPAVVEAPNGPAIEKLATPNATAIEAQSQAADNQAVANAKAAEKQAEADAQAAEAQAQAAKQQAQAAAKQVEAESKAVEKPVQSNANSAATEKKNEAAKK